MSPPSPPSPYTPPSPYDYENNSDDTLRFTKFDRYSSIFCVVTFIPGTAAALAGESYHQKVVEIVGGIFMALGGVALLSTFGHCMWNNIREPDEHERSPLLAARATTHPTDQETARLQDRLNALAAERV